MRPVQLRLYIPNVWSDIVYIYMISGHDHVVNFPRLSLSAFVSGGSKVITAHGIYHCKNVKVISTLAGCFYSLLVWVIPSWYSQLQIMTQLANLN